MVEQTEIFGYQVVAKALKLQGITAVFGILGVPVADLANSFTLYEINYFGFRNE